MKLYIETRLREERAESSRQYAIKLVEWGFFSIVALFATVVLYQILATAGFTHI